MEAEAWTNFQELLEAVEGGTAQQLAPKLRRAQPFLANLLNYKVSHGGLLCRSEYILLLFHEGVCSWRGLDSPL